MAHTDDSRRALVVYETLETLPGFTAELRRLYQALSALLDGRSPSAA